MTVIEFFNRIYKSFKSDDVRDYKRSKITPVAQEISEDNMEPFELILDIIELSEDYKEKKVVFRQFNRKCLPKLGCITKTDLTPLLSLNLDEFPPPIRARVTDFLWTVIKDPKCGKIAVQSYLELYASLWNEEHWPNCGNMIYRAVNIAAGLGKKCELYENCIEAVKSGLERTKGNDRLFLSAFLLEILVEQKTKVDNSILDYARNVAENAKQNRDITKLQRITETLVKIDPLNRNQYYEAVGDLIQIFNIKPALRCVYMLKQAVQYYQKAGAKEKIKQCLERIEEEQSHIPEEMQVFTTGPVDITEKVEKTRRSIQRAKDFKQALITFGELVCIISKDDLLKEVQTDSKDDIMSLFPYAKIDHRGRQIYLSHPLPLNKELDMTDKEVQQHMWEKAVILQRIYVDLILQYAYFELNKLFQYDENDLDFLVNENALIPQGREEIVRRGIFIGLKGDLYTALHILLPQMENIIRYLVEICDGKTVYTNSDGEDSINVLGKLLNSPELKDCFDENLLFCLQGLLVEKAGSNLRNEIAHGLMEPGNDKISLYFLGLLIKILSWYSNACLDERIIMKSALES